MTMTIVAFSSMSSDRLIGYLKEMPSIISTGDGIENLRDNLLDAFLSFYEMTSCGRFFDIERK